jgi:hypothetical protein
LNVGDTAISEKRVSVVVECFGHHSIPMHVADCACWKTLVEFFQQHSGIQPPCSKTVSEGFLQMYRAYRANLVKLLKIQVVTLVLDHWTDSTSHNYLGLIAQWLTASFSLEFAVLEFVRDPDRVVGDNLSESCRTTCSNCSWMFCSSFTTCIGEDF